MEGRGQSGGCGVEESGRWAQEAWGGPRKAFIPQMVPCAAQIKSHLRQTLGNRLVWAVRTWGQESSMSPGEAPGAG